MLNQKEILMLEDEAERIRRFRYIVQTSSQLKLTILSTAAEYIAMVQNQLLEPTPFPALLALDHDLFEMEDRVEDPGDGRDVALHLAGLTPFSPVLIHSSNQPAAESMYFSLLESGWQVDRISPLGEDWIESFWWPTVLELINAQPE